MDRVINILVVEDDPAVSTVLTTRLKSLGYHACGTAETGFEAINGWQQIEDYIASHSEADFTHSICADCDQRRYPELYQDKG